MAKILIVDKVSKAIATKYDADAPNQGSYGGPWGNPSMFDHIEVPAELDHEVVKVDEDGEVVVDEVLVEAKVERQWIALRAARDARLIAADHTQLADSPLSSEVKAAWAAYRQELRDLPENTEDPASPAWPEQP